MKKKLVFYCNVVLAVVGIGLVVSNLVHLGIYGEVASIPAMIGGVIISALAIYRIVKWRQTELGSKG